MSIKCFIRSLDLSYITKTRSENSSICKIGTQNYCSYKKKWQELTVIYGCNGLKQMKPFLYEDIDYKNTCNKNILLIDLCKHFNQ